MLYWSHTNQGEASVNTSKPGAVSSPYSAWNVHFVTRGPVITAVWVSDPAVSPEVALENLLRRDLPYEVEVIAEATRYYKRDGAEFSGWVVNRGTGVLDYSDPIPTKREAMAALRRAVAKCFQPSR